MEKKRKFILIIAVVGMIGTFLPWASAFGFTLSGTKDGGWLTLALFAIGGAIAFFNGEKTEALKKKVMTGVWIPAAVAVIIVLLKILRSRPAGVSNGMGLWLVFFAGLAQVFVTLFFKGEAGWDIPKSIADVKAAASIPMAKEETAPAAPETIEAPPAEEEIDKE
ncbi:MAG: hypothetical protein GQ565_11275 [Candidatus Aegiribacteria sp.]|nr:hypothetical protein [Candidatus Aegiribacteria sp.]